MNVMECIELYIGNVEERTPIFTQEIYESVLKEFPTAKKNMVNEYVTRYAEKHPDFVRYKKGIYYKSKQTPFGVCGIDMTELIRKTYLYDGKKVIGYETGPSYMNKIGLTTQMPKFTFIATENNRLNAAGEDDGVYLIAPVMNVTENNFRYLQLLDMLDNRFKVKIENENPYMIYRSYIERYGLDYERLLNYARLYKNNRIYREIAQTARGEVV